MSKMLIKRLAKKMGYIISTYDPKRDTRAIKKSLFQSLGITIVLDVGANAGYYAQDLRRAGYQEKIVSFEPLSSAYEVMKKAAVLDSKWTACHYALGETNGTSEIFISSNSWSSSLLDMLPEHTNAAPDSQYIAKEAITIKTLDSIFDEHVSASDNFF